MGLIRWIFSISIIAIWAALIGTALSIALYTPGKRLPEAAAIVVLSGPAETDGSFGGETQERVERGIALFKQEAAPRLIFSGGAEATNDPIANDMAKFAREAGVPEDAITVETAARSTLQNALFVADIQTAARDRPILLVSHRYHLPRAIVSFRWAGFENVTGVAADPYAGFTLGLPFVMEGIKWPYNILRAAAASAAMAANVPRDRYIEYLE